MSYRVLVRRNGLEGGTIFTAASWNELLKQIEKRFQVPIQRITLIDSSGKFIHHGVTPFGSVAYPFCDHLVLFNGGNEKRLGTMCEKCTKPRCRQHMCINCGWNPFDNLMTDTSPQQQQPPTEYDRILDQLKLAMSTGK